MSSDAIVPVSVNYGEIKALSKDLFLSTLVPAALKKKPEDLAAIILTGQEMGLGPMQSLRAFHVINGVVTMKAETMIGLIRASRVCEYLVWKESTAKVAAIETKRRGDPVPTTMSFTMEDAVAAGLPAKNPTFRAYPKAMLRARCVSAVAKAVYSDILLGVYEEDSNELELNASSGSNVSSPTGADLKARIKAELAPVDAEFTAEPITAEPAPTEPEPPALTLADQIQAAGSREDLLKLLAPIKAALAEELEALKELYRARVAELKGGQ